MPLVDGMEFAPGISPFPKAPVLAVGAKAILKEAQFSAGPPLNPQPDLTPAYRTGRTPAI